MHETRMSSVAAVAAASNNHQGNERVGLFQTVENEYNPNADFKLPILSGSNIHGKKRLKNKSSDKK